MKGLLTCNLYLYYPYIIKQTDNENIQIYQVKVVILSHYTYTAISIYVVGSKPQAYNPESLKLILIYPYRLSVLSRTLEALIRQRKLK